MFAWLRRLLSRQTSFEIQSWTSIMRELRKTGRYEEAEYLIEARQKAKDEQKAGKKRMELKLYRTLKDSA